MSPSLVGESSKKSIESAPYPNLEPETRNKKHVTQNPQQKNMQPETRNKKT